MKQTGVEGTAERRKPCRVCSSPERGLIEGGIRSGWSPRGLARRFGSLTRRDIARHRDRCATEKKQLDEGEN